MVWSIEMHNWRLYASPIHPMVFYNLRAPTSSSQVVLSVLLKVFDASAPGSLGHLVVTSIFYGGHTASSVKEINHFKVHVHPMTETTQTDLQLGASRLRELA